MTRSLVCLSFFLNMGLCGTFAQAQKTAPWKNGDSVFCSSPEANPIRVDFKMWVIDANWLVQEVGVSVSLMRIEGRILKDGLVIHEFSDEPFTGYWPSVEGTKFEFFFNEGWPQVTYFIARFDLANGPLFENAWAQFYPTRTQNFEKLSCRIHLQ